MSASLAALLFSCAYLGAEPAYAAPSEADVGNLLNFGLILFATMLGLILWGFTAYHLSLVVTGLTTKEYLKGRKHGARKLTVAQRLECCAVQPSEIDPRKLVPTERRSDVMRSCTLSSLSTTQL